jgi:NSS family neurotransmitter:Na+ symporter
VTDAWSGRAGFILATIGSAVGLGSIWKFPYELGAHGGAGFLLFYVLGLVLAVAPLMFAEFAIGRRGASDAAGSIARLAAAHGARRAWRWVGVLGVLAGALILSFYSVIGGWTIAYAVQTAREGLAGTDPGAVLARYTALLGAPGRMAAYHALFLALAATVVARGVRAGIESAVRLLMPLLAALMLALAAYAAVNGDLGATLRFLFHLDAAQLGARAALEALGLGFFSIGVGMGLMITYAAYAEPDIDLRKAALWSMGADTAISLLAGLAVFPIVFAHGLNPASGPGLVFVTLPLAFAAMPFGALAAFAFFALLFVAALASAISMLELAVALVTRVTRWPRPRAAWLVAAACGAGGLATVFSFNLWSDWHPLAALPAFAQATPFDLLDHLTSNVMLPVGGLAIALFAGWALPQSVLAEELRLGARGARLLRGLLRYVVPLLIAAVALAPLFF